VKTLQAQILTHHERAVPEACSVILLLHGLNERGRRIFRKLVKYLPEDAHILAPDGPYMIPLQRPEQLNPGHAWYFYNRSTDKYEVDQTLSLTLLNQLLDTKNPHSLPVTVIGFSQGGYLAPLLGMKNKMVKTVIGLGCEFRPRWFKEPLNFSLHGLHGEEDRIITPQSSREVVETLRKNSFEISWELVPETAHEISSQMGEAIKRILDAKRSL
jgi:predicted esterase